MAPDVVSCDLIDDIKAVIKIDVGENQWMLMQ